MMNKFRFIFFFINSLLLFIGNGAFAHEQREALSKIIFNERSGNVEIMHRISLHDAEHAAKALWGVLNLETEKEARLNFSNYVRSRFFLRNNAGEKISLSPIGQEIEGPYLWVYHETPITDEMQTFTIENRILHEFWDDQSNLVNVERNDERKSFIFKANNSSQDVNFTP